MKTSPNSGSSLASAVPLACFTSSFFGLPFACGSWDGATAPIDPTLNSGFVMKYRPCRKNCLKAAQKSMLTHPPMPALRMAQSMRSYFCRSRLEARCTLRMLHKSNNSGSMLILLFNASLSPLPLFCAFLLYFARCSCNRDFVTSAFDCDRVVGIMQSFAGASRVERDSSIKRQHIAKPRPLH